MSAGYLWSFPLAALVAGLMVKYAAAARGKTRALVVFFVLAHRQLLIIHPLGIAGLKLYLDISFADALKLDALFWIGDISRRLWSRWSRPRCTAPSRSCCARPLSRADPRARRRRRSPSARPAPTGPCSSPRP